MWVLVNELFSLMLVLVSPTHEATSFLIISLHSFWQYTHKHGILHFLFQIKSHTTPAELQVPHTLPFSLGRIPVPGYRAGGGIAFLSDVPTLPAGTGCLEGPALLGLPLLAWKLCPMREQGKGAMETPVFPTCCSWSRFAPCGGSWVCKGASDCSATPARKTPSARRVWEIRTQ